MLRVQNSFSFQNESFQHFKEHMKVDSQKSRDNCLEADIFSFLGWYSATLSKNDVSLTRRVLTWLRSSGYSRAGGRWGQRKKFPPFRPTFYVELLNQSRPQEKTTLQTTVCVIQSPSQSHQGGRQKGVSRGLTPPTLQI